MGRAVKTDKIPGENLGSRRIFSEFQVFGSQNPEEGEKWYSVGALKVGGRKRVRKNRKNQKKGVHRTRF
jgi:hypothetical protein